MVAASMFTNLKKKFIKCEVITANVGNQLKLCNTRSCIKFYFTNLELHPKNIFCYPDGDLKAIFLCSSLTVHRATETAVGCISIKLFYFN